MRVGILGSGLMGGRLGTLFARAGHEVVFSYARSPRKLQRLARAAGRTARHGSAREAVAGADAVLLAVHWSRIGDVLDQAGDLSGKIVITCSLPMNARNTSLVIGRDSSGAEMLAKRIRKARVVSAFHTIPSEALFGVFKDRGHKRHKPSLAFCGNDEKAKRLTATLIRDVGFEPVDCGALKTARYTEPFALLVAELAYGGKAGAEVVYRFEYAVRTPAAPA
jgi:8-hydroxy-5-deazaflavin:NADPH oxidoreductase